MQFKAKWDNTEKGGRIRIIFLSLMSLWFAYLSIIYTGSVYNYSPSNVDADNGIIALAEVIGAGFAGFAALGIYAMVILVFSVVLFLLLRFIGIRKTSVVTADECELSMNIIGLGGAAGLLIGIAVTRFSARFPAVLFTLIWMAAAFLLYLIPLRKAKG